MAKKAKGKYRLSILQNRFFKNRKPAFQIRHCTSYHLVRYRQMKCIKWLQKHRMCLHQAMTDSPVNRLTEITAIQGIHRQFYYLL